MGKFYETIPTASHGGSKSNRFFFVATAPVSPHGHVNVSPKGVLDGTFKLLDDKTCFYQDLTGSGSETAAHLRENGRITIMFVAFEGPPRIGRLLGRGVVHEIGTPEYEALIPISERIPGSRAAVVVHIHKVGTSCGYSIPFYAFERQRYTLNDWATKMEEKDADVETGMAENGMKAYWAQKNSCSIDGMPALEFARKLAKAKGIDVGNDVKKNESWGEGWIWNLGIFVLGCCFAIVCSRLSKLV